MDSCKPLLGEGSKLETVEGIERNGEHHKTIRECHVKQSSPRYLNSLQTEVTKTLLLTLHFIIEAA